ncbi:DEAD/DEAH box helicase [Mycoplasmatota bacterium]|nr:DEAD/DEAH box helicase [Mycoplasmatota bacterium]
MSFNKLEIIEPILAAVQSQGYELPSPIQEQAIPILLSKKDMMASAQTGTGKTAAFAIPILQNITRSNNTLAIKALILTPTRELAMQIKDSFDNYGANLSLKALAIYGGVNQKSQVKNIKKHPDILVATPGRLLDLINQKIIDLNQVQYLVLDEADRMLDMGFIRDVKKIIKLVPEKRQTMLFSATLPKSILNLANSILVNPTRVQITPEETTLESIKQSVFYVKISDKFKLLLHILKNKEYQSVLLFSRTKRFANKITKQLNDHHISAIAIHGNKSQSARTEALYKFKQNQVRVLVATDVASRGIDIDELSLVINYNLPDVPETYIHRIGRTGRANQKGNAITLVCEEETSLLKDIQKHIQMEIPVNKEHPYNIEIKDTKAKNNSNKTQMTQTKKKKKNHHKNTPRNYHSNSKKKTPSNKSKAK